MIRLIEVTGGRSNRGKFDRMLVDTDLDIMPGDVYTRKESGDHQKVFISLNVLLDPGKDKVGIVRYKIIAMFP